MRENNEELADIIRQTKGFVKAEPCFVSIYIDEQVYGGPEEGGWWHNIRTFEGGLPFVSKEAAENYLESQRGIIEQRNKDEEAAKYARYEQLPDEDEVSCPANYGEGYIPRGWSDNGNIVILIEETLGEFDNSRQGIPHYE